LAWESTRQNTRVQNIVPPADLENNSLQNNNKIHNAKTQREIERVSEHQNAKPGNTKGGSITVPLTSCLTGLI
jgi:hypothetical protein